MLAPDDQGGVWDVLDARGEVGFPSGEGIFHGHERLDDTGASAITIGAFKDCRRQEAMVVDHFLQNGAGDQPNEQPIPE